MKKKTDYPALNRKFNFDMEAPRYTYSAPSLYDTNVPLSGIGRTETEALLNYRDELIAARNAINEVVAAITFKLDLGK